MMFTRDIEPYLKVIRKRGAEFKSNNKLGFMAVGYKIKNGKLTADIGIIAFVTRKYDKAKLHANKIEELPKEIDGYPTDIIEIPDGFKLRADDSRYRPFAGGVATINSKMGGTGTLGLVVRKNNDPFDKMYGITNNHIGANEDIEGMNPSSAKKGDFWIQPGTYGGGSAPSDVIAKLDSWSKIKPRAPGKANYYDVAIGEITESVKQYAKLYEIKDIGSVENIEDLNIGDEVMKRGRATLKTVGIVAAKLAYPEMIPIDFGGYTCDFTDQAIIVGDPPASPFSQNGDSGSIIISADKDPGTNAYKAKGLLFSGTETSDGIDLTVANPINKIAEDFGLFI
jgi:hypothetical protein